MDPKAYRERLTKLCVTRSIRTTGRANEYQHPDDPQDFIDYDSSGHICQYCDRQCASKPHTAIVYENGQLNQWCRVCGHVFKGRRLDARGRPPRKTIPQNDL